jgi:hypothetical protein
MLANKICNPGSAKITKVDGTTYKTPLDSISEELSILSSKATVDQCNDAQIGEEPPAPPKPPKDPNERINNFLKENMQDYSMIYNESNINQTIQFIIILFLGTAGVALWKSYK